MQRKKNPSAFIKNTYKILQVFSSLHKRQQLNHIVGWNDAQDGFIIHDLPKFQAEILPQYFKHQKYTSFVRQLNMYGFHKQRHPTNDNYFQHQSFRRGQDLLEIKRKPQKKKKSQQQNQLASSQNINKQNSIQQSIKSQKNYIEQNQEENKNIQSQQEYKHKNNQNIETQCNASNLLNFLCQQAVRQNQSLTSMHSQIMQMAVNLKKYKLKILNDQMNPQDILVDNSILLFQKLIKEQNKKMSLTLDFAFE